MTMIASLLLGGLLGYFWLKYDNAEKMGCKLGWVVAIYLLTYMFAFTMGYIKGIDGVVL